MRTNAKVGSLAGLGAVPLIVSFAARYQKGAGVGTVGGLMLPYVVVLLVVWPALLVAWLLLGLPWGF